MEVTDDNIIISTLEGHSIVYTPPSYLRVDLKTILNLSRAESTLLFFNCCDMFHHHPKPEELCLRKA